MQVRIDAIYTGVAQAMPDDGRPTAIFKTPRRDVLGIGREGLAGDVQADRRVHGGPDKAVHQFPAEHYARFAAAFTPARGAFAPGNIGENFSSSGLREEDVCIGDVFALGSARLQLCQPRTPCWKIDARFGVDGLAQLIEREGIAGWYYRVLQTGTAQAGDTLQLLEREPQAVSLREYWQLKQATRPPAADLLRLLASPGLAENQRQRWQQRFDWLRANAGY